MTSRAHQLFRQITEADDPCQELKDMVTDERTETEYLEFKGAGRIAPKQAKEFWSQALSGFANTEGGVLIWGIRAARVEHPDDASRKVDVASDLDLAPTPATFAQLLKDVLLEACIEPVQGVEFTEIDAGRGDGSGFVLCLIPEGNHKPYRAGLDAAKQYYQRVGDNFVVIPHSLLRSLFYPRTSPLLRLAVRANVKSDSETSRILFSGEMSNTGTATANDVCVAVETPLDVKLLRGGGHIEKSQNQKEDGSTMRLFRFMEAVHPGQTYCVFTCEWTKRTQRDDDGICIVPGDAQFNMRVYARDQDEQRLNVSFTRDDLKGDVAKPAEDSQRAG